MEEDVGRGESKNEEQCLLSRAGVIAYKAATPKVLIRARGGELYFLKGVSEVSKPHMFLCAKLDNKG